MPPKRQTRSAARQQPVQKQQTRRRQRDKQEDDAPTTLYDTDLRNIPLGDRMPALSDNAQLFLSNEKLTDVLRRPEGCTIEALVVDPRACCNSNDDVRSLRGRPWWPRAVQMRTLVAAGTLTLGHWAELNNDERNAYKLICSLLEQRCRAARAAARRRVVTTELTLQRQLKAERRARKAGEDVSRYVHTVSVEAAKAQGRVEGALQAADAMRAQATATAATVQPQQQVARDRYGQKEDQLQSSAVGQTLYNSVYNATWGALQYTADGVHAKTPRAAEDVVLPIVPCGMSPDTLVMDDSSVTAALRKSTAPDVLTLYSPLGWPAMWEQATLPKRAPSRDKLERRVTAASEAQQLGLDNVNYDKTLFVRGEVQRAWRCVVHARDVLQRRRQGSATTQGTATAATAAPAQAQGEQDDNAAEATTQAQAQAPNDDHNDASKAHAPAQDGEHVDAAKAPAQTQVLVTDEQQTSTATTAASVQAQGEPHDDATEAQGQAHEHTKQHSDSTKAQGQLQAGGKQGDDAAKAPAQVQGEAQTQEQLSEDAALVRPHVLVRGTPGIGKSMAVGGYVLYKLLHEEGERELPYVLFEVNELSFVFDKRNKTVACYKRASFDAGMFVSAVDKQCARIFDCSKHMAYDERHFENIGEINIVLTSPNVMNLEVFFKRSNKNRITCYCTMHAWTLREMLLVGCYVNITPDAVVERVRNIGPVTRFVFTDPDNYKDRKSAVENAATDKSHIKDVEIPLCSVKNVAFNDPTNPTNVLYDMRRETDAFGYEDRVAARTESDARVPEKEARDYYFVPLSPYIYGKLMETMASRAKQSTDYLASVLATCAAHPGALEHFVLQSLTYKSFWQLCAHAVGDSQTYCTYMPRGGDGAAADEPDTPLCNTAMQAWMAGLKEHDVVYFDDNTISVTFDVQHKLRVFVPRSRAFPLVDAFVLLYCAERVHYIGIQVTDSDSHRPTADNVRSFYVRHPKIVVAGADGLTPQQPSLTRVTPPIVQVSTRVDSPAMQEASVDVLDKKVLGNVNGTRSMLYVKEYDGNNVLYQQLQSATDVPEDVARNWHTYAQYCCRVRDKYW